MLLYNKHYIVYTSRQMSVVMHCIARHRFSDASSACIHHPRNYRAIPMMTTWIICIINCETFDISYTHDYYHNYTLHLEETTMEEIARQFYSSVEANKAAKRRQMTGYVWNCARSFFGVECVSFISAVLQQRFVMGATMRAGSLSSIWIAYDLVTKSYVAIKVRILSACPIGIAIELD